MKRFSSVLFILIFFQIMAYSQSCLPEGITFTTQSQIDSFQINYPNCTEIKGNVKIVGDNILNLNGLSTLNSFGGCLEIKYNDFLTNLSGMNYPAAEQRGILKQR